MKDQDVLNYMGRLIYNYWSSSKPKKGKKSPDGEEYFYINGKVSRFVINEEVNLFRENADSLLGQVKRTFEYPCLHIREAITLKRLVDISIIREIDIIKSENICHSTYTNSFIFPVFTSNIESHSFSKNGLHVAHVGSLSSYSQIDFSCFDSFDNSQIKDILINGDKDKIDGEGSLKFSQMISLFLCETSRNPTSFFTIPMCLELSEWAFKQYQNKKIDEFKVFINKVHKKSLFFMEKAENADKIIKANEDIIKHADVVKEEEVEKAKKSIAKVETDMKALFIVDIENQFITKGKIVKDIVLNLFPLSMEKAVPASRYISNRINEKLKNKLNQNELYHRYDQDKKGSINDAKKLLAVEDALIDLYKEFLMYNAMDINQEVDYKIPFNISEEWFGISYQEDKFGHEDIDCIKLIGEALNF